MARQNDSDPLFENESPSMLSRLLPPLVLICAFGGFVSLAVYAYRAGTHSVPDGELMVIEADNSPMKEKPADPGGMQFPNQDKTIFEAIGSGEQTAKVERVLPTPEEPIAPVAEASPSADNKPVTGAEQIFGDEDAPAAAPAPQVKNVAEELAKQAVQEAPAAAAQVVVEEKPATPVDLKVKEKSIEPAAIAQNGPEIITQVKEKPPAKPAEKPAEKKIVKPVEKPAVKAEKTATTAPAKSGGKSLAQLGAYKSEAEARSDFARMQKKYPALSGKSPTINRADLGDKGIFFRLRVATDDAKKLCAALAGQACMAVK